MNMGCQTTMKPTSRFNQIDFQGHRGARGLSPENTMVSFLQCYTYGMNTIELDTTLTKDGDLMIHHDVETNPDLCQLKDGGPIEKRPVRQLTVAELKTFDCGSKPNARFPGQKLSPGESLVTLSEFFAKIREYEASRSVSVPMRFNVEVKVSEDFTEEELAGSVEALKKAVLKNDVAKRTTVQSFRLELLPMVKEHLPDVALAALFEPTPEQEEQLKKGSAANGMDILDTAKELGVDIISPYFGYVSSSFLAKAKSLSLKVIPWTVNRPEDMKRLLELGVDGLITDYPDRLTQFR